MVIDLNAERERRRLEQEFNPDPVRDFFEHAAAYTALCAACFVVVWALLSAQPR
jgi:hypothetical protein